MFHRANFLITDIQIMRESNRMQMDHILQTLTGGLDLIPRQLIIVG